MQVILILILILIVYKLKIGYDIDMLGGMSMLHGCGGSTALHIASSRGKESVVKFLLECGSNIEKEDFRGYTALQCAAEGGHLKAFNILLDVNFK